MGTLVILYFMLLVFVLVLVAGKKIHWGWLVVVLIPPLIGFILIGLVLLLIAKAPPRVNQSEVNRIAPTSSTKFGVNPKVVDFTSGFKGLYNFSGTKGKGKK